MFPRRAVALLALVLGAATVALPAIAGSETPPTVEAVNAGIYSHYWVPERVTIAPGGQVTFANPSEVAHGVEWRGAQKPTCEEGEGKVPVGTTAGASGTKWSGSCTFTQAGTYVFWCTVHGAAMKGAITVGEGGTTTTTTTPTTTGTGSTTVPGTAPGTGTTTTGLPGGPGAALTFSELLSAPASRAVSIARSQRALVRGALALSSRAAGGRLEVDLLAARAALASAGHAVLAGRLVRHGLKAGTVRFAVALNHRARHALRRRGRLALRVRIVLTPPGAASVSLTRPVTVR